MDENITHKQLFLTLAVAVSVGKRGGDGGDGRQRDE